MLHEILLSLSGHPSPLWQQLKEEPGTRNDEASIDYISPPERAMLATLAHLSDMHIRLRDHAAEISSSHTSMICRAVSSALSAQNLAEFRKKVVEVEAAILTKDAGYVGGYGIVPLSTIVGEFAPWIRRIEWLWAVTQFILPSDGARRVTSAKCTGASLINYLEKEIYTGYSDLEEMATKLLTVAEVAWMRQASIWILYGKLPTYGAEDFFIQHAGTVSHTGNSGFYLSRELLPNFVTSQAADSILSIGSSLDHIRNQSRTLSSQLSVSGSDPALALLPRHLESLKELTYPLSSSVFASAISSIRLSIPQNALSQLLPFSKLCQTLDVIQDFLLLGRGEFVVSLISQADRRVISRIHVEETSRPVRKVGKVDDLMIKDAEVAAILNQTWSELANRNSDDDLQDQTFEVARTLLHFRLQRPEDRDHFTSIILPSPTVLALSIAPESPLNLFFTLSDINTYSTINAYLLSIRRAEIHLSSLWKLTPLRRCHPTPLGPPMSATHAGERKLAIQRGRNDARTRRMRRQWATAGKALFVMNEMGAYFQGEVIRNSWQHFRDWIEALSTDRPSSAGSKSRSAFSTSAMRQRQLKTSQLSSSNGIFRGSTNSQIAPPSDPATMAHAHRILLCALRTALLLDKKDFIRILHGLLSIIDHFVALFLRLQTVWQALDLQEDEGVVDALINYKKEEGEVWWEMASTVKSIDEKLGELVASVRKMNGDEVDDLTKEVDGFDLEAGENTFVPWKERTIERLIMKLDLLDGRRNEGNDDSMNQDDD